MIFRTVNDYNERSSKFPIILLKIYEQEKKKASIDSQAIVRALPLQMKYELNDGRKRERESFQLNNTSDGQFYSLSNDSHSFYNFNFLFSHAFSHLPTFQLHLQC